MYSERSRFFWFFLQHAAVPLFFFFFFNDTATTEIYTLSLHDALPILLQARIALDLEIADAEAVHRVDDRLPSRAREELPPRSEEHTSELQSQSNLVCRLLLEKKKNRQTRAHRRTGVTCRCADAVRASM